MSDKTLLPPADEVGLPERIADAVLRAAGSGFQYYMPSSKSEIIEAATSIIQAHTADKDARIAELEAMLERWLQQARSGRYRDGVHFSIQSHSVFDDTLTTLNQKEKSHG